eukprot:TRINITY_DN743_c0_g1_i6.p1 TRINITY_DN743_c0_g1~~TRINITY_DN743_c0_g1_i6.p1  ORF type:complete len:210 (+),score=2.90 TRINITY_DN743_c0_g1_i6:81-710(+)
MSYLKSLHALEHEGPPSEEYERGIFTYVSYSMSWPSSGPSEADVPMSSLHQNDETQDQDLREQRNEADNAIPTPGRCKNPMPSSGSRRDSCGRFSVGSEGHDVGLCKGPCKDIRSGRGCTWGKKCKRCHFPHPEVSSASIRGKKSRAIQFLEGPEDQGVDRQQQLAHFGLRGHDDHQLVQHDGNFYSQPLEVGAIATAYSLRLGTSYSL